MVLRFSVRLNIYKGVYNHTISVLMKRYRRIKFAKKGIEK